MYLLPFKKIAKYSNTYNHILLTFISWIWNEKKLPTNGQLRINYKANQIICSLYTLRSIIYILFSFKYRVMSFVLVKKTLTWCSF